MSISTIKEVYLISDGTGETAEKMVRAALHQFIGYLVHVQIFPNIDTSEKLKEIFLLAAQNDVLVISTLVQPDTRSVAHELAQLNRMRHLELLAPLLSQMSLYLRAQPVGVPNQMHKIDDEYFRRIEAVEFTVKGDDGKDPRMLKRADIILLGVSRTSKTPLSVFLAHKGYRVCNIPIVLDKGLPSVIDEVDPNRVFCLTIAPETLLGIRLERLKTMGVDSKSTYGDLDYIFAELDWASSLFRNHGLGEWPVINVTGRAVEETAALILNILNDRGLAHSVGDSSQL
jgi:regulator of PEP synthase PpsR (kinase-PPPase family)